MAFVGAVELVMQLVRRARGPARATTGPAVPGDVEQAVRAAYTASVTAGAPLSQRAMAERFGLSRRKVSQLITQAIIQEMGAPRTTGRQKARTVSAVRHAHGAGPATPQSLIGIAAGSRQSAIE